MGIGSYKKTSKRKNNPTAKQELSPAKKANELEDYFKEEDMADCPPFLRKVLERKNLLYKLMAQSGEAKK